MKRIRSPGSVSRLVELESSPEGEKYTKESDNLTVKIINVNADLWHSGHGSWVERSVNALVNHICRFLSLAVSRVGVLGGSLLDGGENEARNVWPREYRGSRLAERATVVKLRL